MSLFGQVWLWSLLAFVVGVLLTWLLLVRPAQARVRELERRVIAHRAEPVATSADYTATAGSTAPGVDATGPVPEAGFGEVPPDTAGAEAEPPSYDDPQQAPDRHGNEHAETQLFEPVDSAPAQRTEPHHTVPQHTEQQHAGPGHAGSQYTQSRYADSQHGGADGSRGLFQPAVPSTSPQYEQYDQPARAEPDPAPAQPEADGTGLQEMPAGHDEPAGEALLPKRQRREAPPGGFDPPEPIQPSMRAVTRREPVQEGGHSGSLFEPSVRTDSESGDTADAAAAPQPADEQNSPGTQVGPFGPGSAMPLAGGGRPSEDFAVKASVTTLRYCSPESERFSEMVAEVWFRTIQDAERVGFRPIG